MNCDNGKSPWRKRIKDDLGHLTQEQKRQKGQGLSDRLFQILSCPPFSDFYLARHNFVLGGFAPLKDEPQWYSKVMDMERHFAFPRSLDEGFRMGFFRSKVSELIPGWHFKNQTVLVPPPGAPEVTPDILLVPGLGFSPQGHRLGRGKGYYDRYLEKYQGIRWGVCFHEQIFPDLPVTEWDQKVDWVITDKDVIKIKEILPSI